MKPCLRCTQKTRSPGLCKRCQGELDRQTRRYGVEARQARRVAAYMRTTKGGER